MTNLTHNSFLCIYFNSLHVSSNPVLIIRRINRINTTSGSCHCVSVAVSCAHDTATDTEWQLPEIVLTQFVSPDDEHDVLETCSELKYVHTTELCVKLVIYQESKLKLCSTLLSTCVLLSVHLSRSAEASGSSVNTACYGWLIYCA